MVNISPRKKVARTQLKSERDQREEQIQAALLAVDQGRFKSLRAAAEHHHVPYKTLYNRKQGKKSRSEAFQDLQILSPGTEDVLVQHIRKQADFGFPVTPKELRQLAEQLLRQQTNNNDAQLGLNWVSAFKQRHPGLRGYYSHIMDVQRVLAGDPAVVEAYFDLLEQTIAEYNIVPQNIYNMDETGFLIGQSQACSIIIPKEDGKRRRFRSHPGTRETITVIECIGARGTPPLPMVIYRGKNHIQGWYRDHLEAKDWTFATSPNGWTDNDLGLEWLKDCFNKHTQQKAQGNYRLLILDGHGSHVTLEFIQQAWDFRIICLCLPPHATHLLQPLDVSIFGPLQNAFTAEVDKFAGANLSIGKKDFLKMYVKARRVITGSAATKAFKDVGIDTVINREKVLRHMPAWHRDSTPPSSAPQPEDTPTPSTSEEAKKLMAQLLSTLHQRQEEEQASLAYSHRQQRMWTKKFEKFVDRLFNQQVIDQARIQELTAAHANKRNALPGDMNRLSQARVLHQSDLPRLIAQREEQARKEAEKLACKARGKQRAKSKQVLPSLAPMAVQESQESDEEPVFPTSSQLPSFWPVQPPPPFPGSDQMIMVPPPSLPQASSSAIPLEPPFPSWQQQGPLLPHMPPFL
ncbi:uncharacterized protein UTRI_04765 [Ustilago trichophora]|uniref:HTH CENPB-type domain-containing protein n=1 Tax=Ustilago trichophora TaxID=86804 RepID=A0A5C3ED54_9BASI|nr:uncharacterized protein UTRI_04765 [Ustilago trichophora]